MYQYCEKVIELVLKSISISETMGSNLYNAYQSLLRENIICKEELISLEFWLKDIDSFS